jgi:GT2 family glycosyltransferase
MLGYEFSIEFEGGCAYISMARNNLTRKFIASGADELLFIDADVAFPHAALEGLLSCNEEIVAGVYPKKVENTDDWPVVVVKDENDHLIVENGLIEALRMPTGFMKIQRSAIEKMIMKYPESRYIDGVSHKETYNFFGSYVEDLQWFGDDFAFCNRYRKLGGRCWILPNIDFSHTGNKNYKGNFYTYLLTQKEPKKEGLE